MLRHALILSALMGATLLAVPQVKAQGVVEGLRTCSGDYAFCGPSICTETGRMIEVKVAAADCTNPPACTAFFPEAECLCPIFPGPALADVSGGNMGRPLGPGNCRPPTIVNEMDVGDDGLWSLFALEESVPQEINNWNTGKIKSKAAFSLCPASTPDMPNMNTFANCFAFACVRSGRIHGNVEVATCFCPIGESLGGTVVDAGTEFVMGAGQSNPDNFYCSQLPVGAPFPIGSVSEDDDEFQF